MENEVPKPSDMELLKEGLGLLDTALSFLMEMEGPHGVAIAHFVHAALTFGEKYLDS